MPTLRELEAVKSNLSEKDQAFCTSLIASVRTYGRPSEKQAYWLNQLWIRANTPAPQAQQVGSLDRINAMFDAAKAAKLKAPKIKVTAGAFKLTLKQAKETSRNPGAIYVMEKQDYLGKVTREGKFFASRDLSGSPDEVVIGQALAAFSANPEAVAKAYGQQFGECCFCSRELTDKRSVKAGYGPICAEKFGLAWGE